MSDATRAICRRLLLTTAVQFFVTGLGRLARGEVAAALGYFSAAESYLDQLVCT